MPRPTIALTLPCVCCLLAWSLTGCGQKPAASEPAPATTAAPAPATTTPTNQPATAAQTDPAPLPTISLSASRTADASSASSSGDQASADRQTAMAELQPFQSLLGKWRGITRKEVSDFKGVDEPEWVWDFQSDKAHPALVMTSPDSIYFRSLRLTGTGTAGQFQLVATDPEGRTRTFQGRLTSPIEQFQEGGTTVHNRFRLQFEEPGEAKDRWQLILNQQNNDRYLVELSRLRSGSPQRIDTIGHQRQGTSVAQSDTDFKDKTCIISGGLGTIAVSYKGKSYWVCCTGCKAAFDEDPESWLRDLAKKQAR